MGRLSALAEAECTLSRVPSEFFRVHVPRNANLAPCTARADKRPMAPPTACTIACLGNVCHCFAEAVLR